jgi:hypothetical protein
MAQHRRPGTIWMPQRGKLYRFASHGVTVIRPWPAPQAWVHLDGQGASWLGWRPSLDLSQPRAAERAAWARVPEPVRLGVIRAHLHSHQWRALSMLARCPGAMALADSVPLLAAMLSVSGGLWGRPVARPLRSIRALLIAPDGWKRWRRVAGWLGLDDSKAFVRLLRRARIDTGAWTLREVTGLLGFWARPEGRKLLCHTPWIGPKVGAFLGVALRAGAPELITHSLIEDLSDPLAAEECQDFQFFIHMWRCIHGDRLPGPIRSLSQLRQLFNEVCQVTMRRRREQVPREPVGPFSVQPPLEPVDGLRPLTSHLDLQQEAQEMHNCLDAATYASSVRSHAGYAYSAQLEHARATVWILPSHTRPCGFDLSQIEGPSNMRPDPAVESCVEAWLGRHDAWALHRAGDGPRPAGDPLLRSADERWAPAPAGGLLGGAPAYYDDEIPF